MEKISIGLITTACLLTSGCNSEPKVRESNQKYNVLMIMVDDQKPLLESLVNRPNFERLASKGLVFSRGYCNAPACGPSRASVLTGLQPATSGVYYNNQNFRRSDSWLTEVVDFPGHFKSHGYLTAHFGKIFHHGTQTADNRKSFTNGYFVPFSVAEDVGLQKDAIEVTQLKGGNMWAYGPLPDEFDREDTTKMQQDTKNANRTIDLLHKDHDQPFFIALGLWKPHGPWYVPKRYFDMYPEENIPIPESYLEGDLEDLPEIAKMLATYRGFHKDIVKRNLWKKTLQAYYASITYADEQLGRVLDALENSQYADNTIIIFFGDNGFHTGEKEDWSKFKLWDLAARVPMVISLPGDFPMSGKIFNQPVSLVDIYPTLTELCQLPHPETHKLDGTSLVPVLNAIESPKRQPVISTYGRENHAVIDEKYYYIRYRNGSEELYDMEVDEYQWHNIAVKTGYQHIIDSLSLYLPEFNASGITERGTHSWDDFQ